MNNKVARVRSRKINSRQIADLLKDEGIILREDLKLSDYFTYVETTDGRLFYYWREYDEKTNSYPDSKLKGFIYEDINDYLTVHADMLKRSNQASRHAIVPHNHYFKTWDDTGTTYIRDLLTVLPVKPELLDFSPESLLAIDKVIKRKKLPDNVLDDSLFLPAVVGYCGVHLERFDNREILIDYNERDDIYEPYYMDGDRKEPLYIRFYEEASENGRRFSLDEIVDVNFF